MLQNFYITDRKNLFDNKQSGKKKRGCVPITVRQLEAIIRLSEAIAKMSLATLITENHVKEAHRLFQISTLSTANAGINVQCVIPTDMIEMVKKIEAFVKKKYSIGSKISFTKLQEELSTLYTNSKAIDFALISMLKTDFEYSEKKKIMIRKR